MSNAPSSTKKSAIAFSGLGALFLFMCICIAIVFGVYNYNKQQVQRKQELANAIYAQEMTFSLTHGICIPVTDQNVNKLMQIIGAKSNERSFVVSEMQKWSTQMSPLVGPPITLTLEFDPASLTSIAALPTTTPSNELVEKVHVRFIVTSDETSASEVLVKLKSGENWNEVCKQYSLDKSTSQTDCDLGWFPRGVMLEEFENLAFDAPVGEFIGPEQTRYGWVIIQVLGHEIRPYSEGSR